MWKQITDEKELFDRLATHPIQSWAWGEFRKKNGNTVVRLLDDNKKAVQIIFSKIPHTPWSIGTVLKGPAPDEEMLEQLKKIGKQQRAIFIKLEPSSVKTTEGQSPLINLLKKHCVPGKRFFTPTTFWIDLTKSESELLESFHPKTRYNIRVAQKHGVEVTEDSSKEAFEKYLKLTAETEKRQNFYAHNQKYHRLMWEYLHPSIAHLLTARYEGEIITTWIVFVWHDFLYYPYGASTDKYKNVMANNLMMWEAIKFGKRLGLSTFDLWGKEEGKGFTKFKEGYNPKVVEFVGSWDLPVNILYWPYRLAEIVRWFVLKTFR